MSTVRKIAVSQGRAMVGVRHIKSNRPATIGVCPGCWNSKERRTCLTTMLHKMGYRVAYNADLPEGTYASGERHAPGCRHAKLILKNPDPWSRFKAALASSYR